MSPRPLSTRPRDKLYFYFLCHIVPLILFIDSVHFLPPWLLSPPQQFLKTYYATTYSDPLTSTQPTWFLIFVATEFLIQLPLAIWGLWALTNDSPLVPLGVGVFSALAGFTTWVCIGELFAWDNETMGGSKFGWGEKVRLGGLYGVYGVAFSVMAVDMACRIKRSLLSAAEVEGRKKGK